MYFVVFWGTQQSINGLLQQAKMAVHHVSGYKSNQVYIINQIIL